MRVLDTPLVAVAVVALTASPAASAVRYHASPIRTVSRCRGQNAEVEQAVDPARGYVYEDWMGCHGIGFARSTDGGRTFHRSITCRARPRLRLGRGTRPWPWVPTERYTPHS